MNGFGGGLVKGGRNLMNNAGHLAVACELAFSDNPAGEDEKLAETFDRVEPFDTGETEGFVAANMDNVVVAFRGAANPLDWISNLEAVQTAGYGGMVNRGFHETLEEAWMTVLRKVKRFRNKQQALWVIGHSSGGALATLAAKRFQAARIAPHATFTFGAPRVFDPKAAGKFKPLLYRFVNDKDIVPHVPPPLYLLYRYRHAGHLVHLLPGGKVMKSEGERAPHTGGLYLNRTVMRATELLTRAPDDHEFARELEDHKIENYISRIGQELKRE